MNTIISVIKWIIKLPVFWMPVSWKGYRRIIITALLAVCAFVQGLDLVNIADGICNIVSAIFHKPCDLQAIAVGITTYIGLLYEALKDEAETSVFSIFKSKK